MADVLAGFLITSDGFQPLQQFGTLLGASICFYWAGMVFNDVFDVKQDLIERPNRPIPSGAIPRSSAITFGVVLLLLGNGLAATSGLTTLMVAACLTGSILAYDSGLKKTPLGPIAMGSCRFFNVLMAASSGLEWSALWQSPQLPFAAGLGVYVVGLTWFARNEAATSARPALISATLTSLAGIGLVAAVAVLSPGLVAAQTTHFALAAIALIVGRRMLGAIQDPTPHRIQSTIKTMLLSIVTIDAVMVYSRTGNISYAILTVALIIPAMVLSKRIAMT